MTCFLVCREDLARFRYPTDLDTAKDLGRVLSKYKNTHYNTVLMAVVVTYVLYPISSDCMSVCVCVPFNVVMIGKRHVASLKGLVFTIGVSFKA